MNYSRIKSHRRVGNTQFMNALVEWLEHKSWCASETKYHSDSRTGEKIDEPCNCGLKTLRDLLL